MKTYFFTLVFLFFCLSSNGQIELYPQVGISHDNLMFSKEVFIDASLVDLHRKRNILFGLTLKKSFQNGLSLSINGNSDLIRQRRCLGCTNCPADGCIYDFDFKRVNVSLEMEYKIRNFITITAGPRSSFLTNYETHFSTSTTRKLEQRKLGSKMFGYNLGIAYTEKRWLVALKYSRSQFINNTFHIDIESDSYFELSTQYRFEIFGKNKGTKNN